MSKEDHVQTWSNKLLDYLLQYRQQNTGFKFWLRQRDRGDRLSNGYWFQGNDNYIFLSFWARSGGTNMTRSLGWVLGIEEDGSTRTSMEVAYNGEKDRAIISLYQTIIKRFKMEPVTDTKYKTRFTETDPFKSLEHYLKEIKPTIDEIIRKAGKEEMFITDEKFNEMLTNTLSLRQAHTTSNPAQPSAQQVNTYSMDIALNQIFFGPPGTGKTYHTVTEAIKIVDPEFYRTHSGNRIKLKERFRELLIKDWKDTRGQIAFCTFHQSFSYEDFVEGIKPVSPEEGDTYLKYTIEDGIFKRICRLSEDSRKAVQLKTQRVFSWNEETYRKAIFYKISLGNTNKEDDQIIYDYCIKNNCIAIGYGGEIDFTGSDEESVLKKCKEAGQDSFSGQAVNRFINYLKVGNYVLVSNGNRYVRAIGKVTGPYRFDANPSINFRHYRSVEWIVKDENIPISELYDRALSQQTIYKLDEDGVKKEFFVNIGQQAQASTKQDKKYVLIIDEINRGNVSSIFGELITLIEKDKRASGNPDSEELEVTLPYSKESFKVPDNVYLIGTMNTADRSIEALDTALRRRFSFREMQSNPALFSTESVSKGKIGSIDLVQLLNTINQRIEKLIDKDHAIGHAYFMEDTTDEALRNTFHNKVIPLLQEYFFGDFGKIGLVLGNSFVEKVNAGFEFAKFEGYDSSVSTDLKERPVYKITAKENWNFKSIYE